MTGKQKLTMAEIYYALCGVVSEMGAEFFDSFYRPGNGEKMMNDLEGLLRSMAPEFFEVEEEEGGD